MRKLALWQADYMVFQGCLGRSHMKLLCFWAVQGQRGRRVHRSFPWETRRNRLPQVPQSVAVAEALAPWLYSEPLPGPLRTETRPVHRYWVMHKWLRCRHREVYAWLRVSSAEPNAWVKILSLPPTNYVALGKWLNLAKPHSPCSCAVSGPGSTPEVVFRQFSRTLTRLFVSFTWELSLAIGVNCFSLWHRADIREGTEHLQEWPSTNEE